MAAPLIVITGATHGIGRALALAFAAEGHPLLLIARHAEAIAELASHPHRFATADVTDYAALAGAIEEAEAEFGPVDCLVNNAGVTSLRRGDLLQLSPESFDRCLGVNLRGTFFLTQAVARAMIDCESDTYRSIVTITSVNADIIGVDRGDYCMSKAALAMMSKLFAARLAAAGIHVFELRPGIIRTDMTAPATEKYDRLIAAGGVPLPRWGEPEDVGASIATIAKGGLPFATGAVVEVDGGLHLHRL